LAVAVAIAGTIDARLGGTNTAAIVTINGDAVSQSEFALRLAGRESIAPSCRVRQTDGYGRFSPNSNIPIPDDIDRKAPGRTYNTDG
jgi:hypothetical protein